MPTWHSLFDYDQYGRPSYRRPDTQSLLADLISADISAAGQSVVPAPEPIAPELPPVQPPAAAMPDAGPSRADQAARFAQDVAYGRSDWERAGQALAGEGRFEEASGLRRTGAVLGGVGLGTLALASWIPGFNVFKPAQAARAARAFGTGAAEGARAGTGIVRGGMGQARELEQARRAATAAESASIAGARGRDMVDELAQERRTFYDLQYTLPEERLSQISPQYRRLQEVLHRQGFDAPPSRINADEFSRLSSEGHIPIYRGFWDADPSRAAEWAESTISGPMRVHEGLYGTGIYVATDPAYALSYATPSGGIYAGNVDGRFIRGFVNKDANLLVSPTPGQEPSSQFRQAVEAFRRSHGIDSLEEISSVPRGKQKLLFSEFLAASGYDGLLVPATGELVLLNRSATAWQSPVSVPSSLYSESYTSPDRAREIIESFYRGGGIPARPPAPPSRPAAPFDYPSQTGL
jgi:hypothetical protein